MFNRNLHNRLQADDRYQENLRKQRIVFCFYLLSLVIWSFILPTPIYFLLCGVQVIGAVILHVILHVFPELDEKLGRAADWLVRKYSQLMNNDTEAPTQELSPSINHSLIHRRLSQDSIDSTDTDSDKLYYDEDRVRYNQLFEELRDVIDLPRPSTSFRNVRRSNQRYC